MATSEPTPASDADFLASDPLLRQWVSETLDQPAEATRDQLQLALLRKIEEYDFSSDGDLDLACSLLAGNECREGSRTFALNTQLKREVEGFAKEFFAHEVRNRLLLFEDLKDRCADHAGLIARLKCLEPGLQTDATVVDGLDGKVAQLARLILELFILPQPEQARVRRERSGEIFASTPRGVRADNPEWCKAAYGLHNAHSQIAWLDSALLQNLGWSPTGKRRSNNLIRKPVQVGVRSRQQAEKSSGSGVFWFALIGVIVPLISHMVSDNSRSTRSYTSRDFATRPYVAPQHLGTSQQFQQFQQKRVPLLSEQLRSARDAAEQLKKGNADELTQILGKETADSILNRLKNETSKSRSIYAGRNIRDLQSVIDKQIDSPDTKVAMLTIQVVKPAKAGQPRVLIVGVGEQLRHLPPENFATAVMTIRNKFYDVVSKPPDTHIDLQTKKFTEIIEIYDYFAATGHQFQDQESAAIEDFRAVNYELRVRSCLNEGKKELALTILNEAIDRFPERAEFYARRGSVWKTLDHPRKAIEDLSSAINIGPEAAGWFESRGAAKAATGDLAGAVFDFNRAIAIDPDWVRSYYGRAYARWMTQQYQKVVDDLDIALKLQPGYLWALDLRARAFVELHEFERAAAAAEAITKIEPNSISAWNLLSTAHCRLRRFDDAFLAVERAIQLGENGAWTYNQRAWCRHNLEEYDQAIIDCDEGLKLHPAFHHLWNTRSLLHAQRGNFKQASADIDEAMRLAPDDGLNHWVRGDIRRRQGHFAKAIDDFDRAIELLPDFAEAYAAKALILAACPDETICNVEQARPVAARSIGLTSQWSSAISLDALAAVYAAEGDFESAVENVTKALKVASGVDDLDDMRARLELYKAEKPFMLPPAASDKSPDKNADRNFSEVSE